MHAEKADTETVGNFAATMAPLGGGYLGKQASREGRDRDSPRRACAGNGLERAVDSLLKAGPGIELSSDSLCTPLVLVAVRQ